MKRTRKISNPGFKLKVCWAAVIFLMTAFSAFGQNRAAPLAFGQTVERQIKGGETLEFEFKLKRAMFARAEVEPSGIDLIVSIIAPDGAVLTEMDGDVNYLWRESVSVIADKSGTFKLRITGKGKAETIGNFAVKLAELRKSAAPDDKRIEAEHALIRAVKFGQDNKSDESAKNLETAAVLWREIGDEDWEAVTNWNLAWTYYFLERTDEALKMHEQSLAAFQKSGDRIGEAAALNAIGVIDKNAKRFEPARANLEKSLAIRRDLKRLKSEFNTLNILFGVYFNLNQPDKVLESLSRMLEISRTLKNRADERNTLGVLSTYYSLQGQNEKELFYLEKALEIDAELKDDAAGEVKRRLAAGALYAKLQQFDKARTLIDRAAELAEAASDKKTESNVLTEIGSYYALTAVDYDKARNFLLKALKIKTELNDDVPGQILLLGNLALVSQGLGEYEKQIEYSRQALEISRRTNDEIGQIDALQSLGVGYNNTGQNDQAAEFYEQSLALARSGNFKLKEVTALSQLSVLRESAQQFEKAREMKEQAFTIAEETKNSSLIILTAGNLGNSYATLKDYDKARAKYEYALKIARETNNRERESDALQKIGLMFAKLKQFEKAQSYFEQSLQIIEENKLVNQQIYVLSSLGDLEAAQSRYESAVSRFEQAFKLAAATKNLYWQTSLYFSLGNAYLNLNQTEKAQIYFEQSLAVARQSKNYMNEAFALVSLGDKYFRINQYEKARQYYEEVLELARKTKDRRLLGFATGGIGSVYSDLNDNVKAQDNYEQSLAVMKESLNRGGEGNVLNSLGNVYYNLRNYQKAQSYYEQSLAIAREIKNKQSEVYPLVNLGGVFQNQNQTDKARSFYEQGLTLAREVKNRAVESYALKGLGEIYFKQKNYQQAEENYRQSLSIAKEVQNRQLEAGAEWNLMNLFAEQKKNPLAVAYGKQAINIFQEIRGNIKNFEKETQQSFLKDKEEAYRRLAEILISEARLPEAQSVLTLLKDEEYAQLRRGGEKSETIPYNEAEEQVIKAVDNLADNESRRRELENLQNEKGNLSAAEQKELDGVYANLEKTNAAFEAALTALKTSESSAAERIGEIESQQNLTAVLEDLNKEPGAAAAAIYTVIGTEPDTDANIAAGKNETRAKFGWMVLVTAKGSKAYPIDVRDLEKTVFDFRSALKSDRYDPQPLAQKLYEKMFRQTSPKQKTTLEADLKKILGDAPDKTILWSLDGVLRYIPVAALHDGKNYLVGKYRSVIFTKESLAQMSKADARNWKILGLGVSTGNPALNMTALPGVAKELKDIVRQPDEQTGIIDGERRLDQDFTKEAAIRLWRRGAFPVVHISSHFSFNQNMPESFLLVGDGKIKFSDLQNQNGLFNSVDLLTLSACDTNVSGNGKEAESFAWLAQHLGAKSVIASLWEVSDAGTPELMIRFYELRKEHPEMSKSAAFQQAQLSMLGVDAGDKTSAAAKISGGETTGRRSAPVEIEGENKDLPLFAADKNHPFAHPYYWAAFVLIGNWR